MDANNITLAEVRGICDRLNARNGRSPASGLITIKTVQDALDGKLLAHHPVTTEIFGEITRLKDKKTKPQKQPRKKNGKLH